MVRNDLNRFDSTQAVRPCSFSRPVSQPGRSCSALFVPLILEEKFNRKSTRTDVNFKSHGNFLFHPLAGRRINEMLPISGQFFVQ